MNKNLLEVSQKIAAELGCFVTLGGNEYCQKIMGAEVPFIIYSVWSTQKFEIDLNYPCTADGKKMIHRDLYPAMESPSIKVSATRAPAAIAADIKRRFFPAAKGVYAACLERVKQADDYGATCARNAAAIECLFRGAVVRQDSPNSHATVSFNMCGLTGHAEVLKDSVNLKLDGSIVDMLTVLTIVKSEEAWS